MAAHRGVPIKRADEKELRRLRRNSRKKTIIGIFLLAAIVYFVSTNFDLVDLADWPKLGLTVDGPSQTCTEIRGPKVMTDTEVRQLEIEDLGFAALRNENKATVTVRNKDTVAGKVRVMVFCRNGNEQGDETRTLEPGATELFNFLDVPDCDLEYVLEPELMRKRVEKTVYVTDTVCE